MKGKYIAFFDSGVGGLSLLVACAERYPRERYLYFGDNANAPYGNRGAAEIRRLTQRAFERLARYPVAAAVIACNTVTAECVDFLREKYAFPIVGVEPAVRPACVWRPTVTACTFWPATSATLPRCCMSRGWMPSTACWQTLAFPRRRSIAPSGGFRSLLRGRWICG